MIEISISKVSKNFGFKKVLDNFDFDAMTLERIALIGPNGCGKTTLLKLIAGIENPNSGNISIRKDATIGLLDQIPNVVSNECTVNDILTIGLKHIYQMEDKLRELELKMSNSDPKSLDSLLRSYGRLQEEFEQVGGYELNSRISKVTNAFKIKDEMLSRPFNSLSGGEKTIINLASLVLSRPSILLLDEPTNHLDIDTLEWLENFLSNYNGTVIISSHDRYFLDKVATKTVLIENGKSEMFFGNYSYYLKENEARVMNEFNDFKDQEKQIEAMKASIKKLQEFGRLAAPLGGAFFKRAASIQKRLDKVELLDKPLQKKDLPLNFEIDQRSGNDVLLVNNLDLMAGDKVLLKGANFYIKYKEKVCLMGKNGTGKSTFIKTILDNSNSSIKLGSNVLIGYIPQEIQFEDINATVLDEARKTFVGTETQLRLALAKFLFYDETVFKRVGNLSGGEKVRLKLLELIQTKANFLILDEPTNHIDIETKEMLEEALTEYQGSVLFISHDRYFINKLAERVLNIKDYKVTSYMGNYDYYKEHKDIVPVVNNKKNN